MSVNAGAGGGQRGTRSAPARGQNDVEARKAPGVGSAGPETWSASCAAGAHPRPEFLQHVIVR
jgi:hypothetical protein